jgi:hypothetical protein
MSQVREPVVRGRDAAQVLRRVGQHQARPVDVEHRVGCLHHFPDRILQAHLTEPQPAQLDQRLPHVLEGNLHIINTSRRPGSTGW